MEITPEIRREIASLENFMIRELGIKKDYKIVFYKKVEKSPFFSLPLQSVGGYNHFFRTLLLFKDNLRNLDHVLLTLTHELIHVKQYQSNIVSISIENNGGYYSWKNKTIPFFKFMTIPYLQKPEEKHAFSLQYEFLKQFNLFKNGYYKESLLNLFNENLRIIELKD